MAARFLQLHEQQPFYYSLENGVPSNDPICTACLIIGMRCSHCPELISSLSRDRSDFSSVAVVKTSL